MKGQPNRLVSDGQAPFGGAEIDRNRPLRFRLNGITIHGFAGDTVLSAALANGIDTVGQWRGWPMALSPSFAPAIVEGGSAALPMARTPATDGADYRTVGARLKGGLTDMVGRWRGAQRSLGLDLDASGGLDRAWITADADAAPPTDMVVVGGGIAGLAAALTAARSGLRVTLLEAALQPGGHARLFGTQDGDEAPDRTIARLRSDIAGTEAISVRVNAEAFAVRQGVVRAHVIERVGDHPQGRVVDFAAEHVVLATGSIEQLPIFPGNRLPGTFGVADAHALAHRQAVWPGRRAALATVSSPAYRLAMQARDSGIEIARVIDGRNDPQSRFVAFSKAYGITMAAGTMPALARPDGKGLAVLPRLAVGDFVREETEIMVDRLLLCGGWQPDLTLWHMAGGQSAWDAAAARIAPHGTLDGIALAGSALGLRTSKACLASGEAAVALLLGQQLSPVRDELIDAIYETPDGPAPMAERGEGQPPAFLGNGHSLLDRPTGKPSRWPSWVPFVPRQPGWQLAETPHPLEVTDITAGVRLGAIPAESAGIVAQERVAMVSLSPDPTEAEAADGASHQPLPPYLEGRFDGETALWIIVATEKRRLDTGALIFRSADDADPMLAVGVVVRQGDGAAMALLGQGPHAPEDHFSLRENGRAVPVRLVAPYQAGMALTPALGGKPGAA